MTFNEWTTPPTEDSQVPLVPPGHDQDLEFIEKNITPLTEPTPTNS